MTRFACAVIYVVIQFINVQSPVKINFIQHLTSFLSISINAKKYFSQYQCKKLIIMFYY